MEFSQLRALIAINDLGNFTLAGKKLNLSPPAVLKQIRQLEEELGAKLYERIGKLLGVTPVGQVIVRYGHCILRQHDEAIVAAREVGDIKRGSLHFGCSAHTNNCVIPPLLRAFLALYPKIQVSVSTRDDGTLLNELHEGRVDVALMTLPVEELGLESDPLWQCEMVFVVQPSDPVSSLRLVTARDIQDKPFILYRRSEVIEAAIRGFCDQVGFDPNVVMDDDQADSIKELIKLGLGISLLPLWSVSEDVRRGKLRILRLKDRHLFHQMGLVHRKSTYRPAVLGALSSVAHRWPEWLPMAKDIHPIVK
jgi:DNA-binding transcriptional LysR family regulator